ncbi:major facilitator superfamily domain-containing protein [Butyriboletus roseoflavus]|nr:major facilitator superfamily domain-containing protein [Butyriboletus roseoflavus]
MLLSLSHRLNVSHIGFGNAFSSFLVFGDAQIVRTVMTDTTSLDKNNVQQAMLFLLYSVGFSIGPVIGGFLVSASFRWVFAINLPCTVIAMFLCFVFLRNRYRVHGANDEEEHQAAIPTPTANAHCTPLATMDTLVSKLALIDWVGTFLFVSGGILVLLALNWGPDDNWKSARVIVNIILGALLIVLYLLWEILLEQRSPSPSSKGTGGSNYVHTRCTGLFRARPMIPIEMFTSYDMCVVQYDSFISGMVMFVMFYFVAIFATVVTGLPPAQAGIQLLYFAPGLGGGSLISIRLIKLFRQPIYPIVLGNVIMTVGVGLIQMAMQRNVQGEVNGFMAMAGVGVGMSAGPVVIHARFVKPNHVAITNALMFSVQFGGTVGLAQCFTILNAKVNGDIASQLSSLVAAGTLTASDIAALASLLNSGGLSSVTSLDGLPSVVQEVVRDAFRDGVRWGFVSLVPWLGVGCVVSVFLSRIADSEKKEKDGEGEGEGKEKGGSEGQSEAELVEMKPRTDEDVKAAAEDEVR